MVRLISDTRTRLAYAGLMICFLLSCASCRARDPLPLVRAGKSAYQIVLPDKPAGHERRAAEVLQDFLKRISGATLPIVPEQAYRGQAGIFVGKTRMSPGAGTGDMRYDGFSIVTEGNNLFIRGNSGKGALYGVYTFLDTYLGCRKHNGGEPAMVPETPDVVIPGTIRDIQSPQFIYRQSYYPASEDPEYLDWHKLHRFEDLWGVWGHSFFRFLPPEEYFREHPEYYAQVAGKRQATQLCLSNEAVAGLTIAYLRKAMKARPDAMYWSVSPNDDGGYCTCDLCKRVDQEEGGPQGSLIRFVNRIAREFPDHLFTTLAYGYSAAPPRNTKPADNVYVFLSTIDAFRTRPLSEEPSAAGFRKNLAGWSALTDRLFIWDYTTQFTNFLTPFPDYMHVAQNLRYFTEKKVKGVFFHGSEDTYGDMAELNSYLQARLLWDPGASAAVLFRDFCTGYYGAAGPEIAAYADSLYQALHAGGAQLDIYGNPVNNHADYLSPKHIDRYSEILDRAEQVAAGRGDLAARLARVRLSLEYVVLQQSVFYGAQQYGYMDEDGLVRKGWQERVDRFVRQCEAAGVRTLAEGGQSPAAYRKAWQDRLDRPREINRARGAELILLYPFSPEYPARGAATLIDGLSGERDYSYNWLLFYGKDMVATIDLREPQQLKSVTAGFLYDPRHYLFLPVSLRVEVSGDGHVYREAGRISLPAPEEGDMEIQPRQFTVGLPSAPVRFVRVTAVCPPRLPVWRYHETKKPAVACDEILIR